MSRQNNYVFIVGYVCYNKINNVGIVKFEQKMEVI